MSDTITIFLGQDPREIENYEVCAYSIRKNATVPVKIVALNQVKLRNSGKYWRNIPGEKAATEFSFTRFLIPWLCNYKGHAVFIDSDNVITGDVADLTQYFTQDNSVWCVQHDYSSNVTTKMDGCEQINYPKKNWSSFMIFNNAHSDCKNLHPTSVSKESGAYLHRFDWTKQENIGSLPQTYNYLVGEFEHPEEVPFNSHYTLGSPMFENHVNDDEFFSQLWFQYYRECHSMPHKNEKFFKIVKQAESVVEELEDATEVIKEEIAEIEEEWVHPLHNKTEEGKPQ